MQLMTSNNKTMSSRDLQALINDARSGVEPSIRLNKLNEKIEDELEGEHYPKSVVKNPNNTESVVYELTLDQCMLISMRESKAVRKSVLSRLKVIAVKSKEIETPEQLLARAVISAQAVIDEKNQLLEQARPAIELHESIVNDHGTLSMRDAGKQLQVKPNKFIEWLRDAKYLNYDNYAYQSKIDAGYMRLSTTEHNGKPRTNTRVTGKGFAHFGKKIAEIRFSNPDHLMFYRGTK
jgi:phage antirepressor YoqD-like protein